jgi:hypothetical protein
MTDATTVFNAGLAHWLGGGVLAVVLGFVVMFWPGPVSITDRLPFALLFFLSGGFAVYHAYAESTGAV